MKKIKIKNKEYTYRNLGSEIMLDEISIISRILEGQGDYVEKWLKVIKMLGSTELVEVLTAKNFVKVVKDIQISNIKNEIKEEIEVNGRVYKCELDEGDISLTAKDMATIERLANKGGNWGNKAFAVVYKDVDLSDNEHYDKAHIEHKAKLFGKKVDSDTASPVLYQIGLLIVGYIEELKNMSVNADS